MNIKLSPLTTARRDKAPMTTHNLQRMLCSCFFKGTRQLKERPPQSPRHAPRTLLYRINVQFWVNF